MGEPYMSSLLKDIQLDGSPIDSTAYVQLQQDELVDFMSFLDQNKRSLGFQDWALTGQGTLQGGPDGGPQNSPFPFCIPLPPDISSPNVNNLNVPPLQPTQVPFQPVPFDMLDCPSILSSLYSSNSPPVVQQHQPYLASPVNLPEKSDFSLLMEDWVLVGGNPEYWKSVKKQKYSDDVVLDDEEWVLLHFDKDTTSDNPAVVASGFFESWPSFGVSEKMEVVMRYTGHAFYFGVIMGAQTMVSTVLETMLRKPILTAGTMGLACWTVVMTPEILLNVFGCLVLGGVISGTAVAVPVLIIGTGGVLVSASTYHAYIASKRTVNRTCSVM
eukprot:TRINITY_DN12488_c0_g1_i1.p1 TRINITY_DN12488_c0_g1~~TRINITY_DN12488_c0_g1_i1.p1  ORF type:complete len:346 (-),score=62.59 TRINITY_DN12488_c0_g1_i1:42-1025(-)